MSRRILTVLLSTAAFVWASAAGAAVFTYDYTAYLWGFDHTSNSITSTATGSFSYDDALPAGLGFYDVTEISFFPGATADVPDLICSPVSPGCLDQAGDRALFNPSSSDLDVFLDNGSYHLDYYGGVGDAGNYSNNDSYGYWEMTDLSRQGNGGNGPAVPEPSAALVFGLGAMLVSGWLRRRQT